MTVRLLQTIGRFIVVTSVVALLGVPAMADAVSEPSGLVPNAARQPVFHRSQSSGVEVGAIRIPDIALDETIRSGVSLSVIDLGVAHWAGTAAPGEPGNVVLAGHRTTFTRPFHRLDELDPGDLVYIEDADGFEVMYAVTDVFVVDPNDLWITYDGDGSTLTMFACHPKGSARFRLVVRAELVAGRRIA